MDAKVLEGRRSKVGVLVAALALSALVLFATGCSSSSKPIASSSSSSSGTTSHVATIPAAAQTSGTPKTDASGGEIASGLTVSGDKKKAPVGAVARPSDATVVSHAKELLSADQGATVRSASVSAGTQDSKGTWWILLSVQTKNLGVQKAVITFDGKHWDDPVFGSGISDTDLPKDVRF